MAAAPPEPTPPNRTLSSLNLAYNGIHTAGRALLDMAQEASPGLARVELVGNPCLSCGPTASLGAPARAAIKASWAAAAELEGGAVGIVRKVAAAALEAVPEALPLVGYEPPPTPRPPEEVDENGDPKAPPEDWEAPSKIEAWEGIDALAGYVCNAIGSLVGKLGDPEALKAALKGDYGVLVASRGLPAGVPFERFGECLISGMQKALGEAMSEEATAAWRDAYADAAASMQEAYTLSQLAEAAAAAAAAKEAEGDEEVAPPE